jgi:hypothetical protein
MAGTNTAAVGERRMWEAYRAELIRFSGALRDPEHPTRL